MRGQITRSHPTIIISTIIEEPIYMVGKAKYSCLDNRVTDKVLNINMLF